MIMLRAILVSVCFISSAASFSQDTVNQVDSQGRKQGFWRKMDKDNLRVYEGQFRDDIPYGKFTYFYQNSKIRTVSLISEEGRTASTTSWFPNSKLMAKGRYIDQKRDSLWQFFSEYDGSLVSEEFYAEGVKHGPEKIFYPGKGISEIIPWVDGVKEGIWEQFYDDGAPKLTGAFKNGEKDGPLKTFFINGKLLVSGFYTNGHQDSTWIYYDDKGSVTLKEYYDDGILLKSEEMNP
ncbi:MAG: toxin-antitoxin system YwqK family antitoxin [Bacteroidales bacterium]|nr:toxin-antitoxin system YwqK family antitoxin [Bacteroidales bacterium]